MFNNEIKYNACIGLYIRDRSGGIIKKNTVSLISYSI